MKNSSASQAGAREAGFLTFHIRNQALYKVLTAAGITFEGPKKGEFSDDMTVILPSGREHEIHGSTNLTYPFANEFASVSAWLVAVLLWESLSVSAGIADYGNPVFGKAMLALLNEAGLTDIPWEEASSLARFGLPYELRRFNQYDQNLERADLEHAVGEDGDIGPCEKISVRKGKKYITEFTHVGSEESASGKSCSGLTFALSGSFRNFLDRTEFAKYIEELGGKATTGIRAGVDYYICNPLNLRRSTSDKAASFGIVVLSESEFLRKFADHPGEFLLDDDEFDDDDDDEITGEELWDALDDGTLFDLVEENMLGTCYTETWETDHWES